ncbi:hypothetical protein JL09_g4911 [Pichia kudriavzevii]|uniref:Uncharacterized protein n=1 Tax=Pichia kudriavzevii TaxID=4909 RepID=A0A099NVG3_PICKU|nr:hypothetical protein JL09_g4911 [Pichia kudriavzevii]
MPGEVTLKNLSGFDSSMNITHLLHAYKQMDVYHSTKRMAYGETGHLQRGIKGKKVMLSMTSERPRRRRRRRRRRRSKNNEVDSCMTPPDGDKVRYFPNLQITYVASAMEKHILHT